MIHEPGCSQCAQCSYMIRMMDKIGEAAGVTEALELKEFCEKVLSEVKSLKKSA